MPGQPLGMRLNAAESASIEREGIRAPRCWVGPSPTRCPRRCTTPPMSARSAVAVCRNRLRRRRTTRGARRSWARLGWVLLHDAVEAGGASTWPRRRGNERPKPPRRTPCCLWDQATGGRTTPTSPASSSPWPSTACRRPRWPMLGAGGTASAGLVALRALGVAAVCAGTRAGRTGQLRVTPNARACGSTCDASTLSRSFTRRPDHLDAAAWSGRSAGRVAVAARGDAARRRVPALAHRLGEGHPTTVAGWRSAAR